MARCRSVAGEAQAIGAGVSYAGKRPTWGETEAVFLIGGYAHYNCPYVWVRAGHSLLGSFGSDEQLDAPLHLHSTQAATFPARPAPHRPSTRPTTMSAARGGGTAAGVARAYGPRL